jgi:CheY-like chemotaxis protein
MLKRLGYQADLVVNGMEDLQALENQQYDVILMTSDASDGWPRGYEGDRARWPPAEQPYIIAITAYAHLYSVEMCLNAGMNDYILKLFNLQELGNAINVVRQVIMKRYHISHNSIGHEGQKNLEMSY